MILMPFLAIYTLRTTGMAVQVLSRVTAKYITSCGDCITGDHSKQDQILLLRGTIVNRTHGIH